MPEPAQKWENYAIFKQNYTLELFIALKMAYCCCLGLRGNLDFPDFLQKMFYNINYWSRIGAVSESRDAQVWWVINVVHLRRRV